MTDEPEPTPLAIACDEAIAALDADNPDNAERIIDLAKVGMG